MSAIDRDDGPLQTVTAELPSGMVAYFCTIGHGDVAAGIRKLAEGVYCIRAIVDQSVDARAAVAEARQVVAEARRDLAQWRGIQR